MSGLKETDMAFAAEQARAVALHAQARAALAVVRALAGELEAVAGAGQAAAFGSLSQQVNQMLARADEAATRAGALFDRPRGFDQVETECARVVTEVEEQTKRYRHLRTGLDLGASVGAALGRLEAQTALLNRWDRARSESLRRGCADLRGQIDAALRGGQNPERHRQAVDGLRRQLGEFEESALSRETQDTARRHLIATVVQACARLNYSVSHAPAPDPNAASRFEVNTGCYGVLRFELGLDAVLRTTDPRVRPGACEKWVERFEDQMGRLGVRLRFRSVQTGHPVRRSGAAQAAQTGQPVHTEQVGGAS